MANPQTRNPRFLEIREVRETRNPEIQILRKPQTRNPDSQKAANQKSEKSGASTRSE